MGNKVVLVHGYANTNSVKREVLEMLGSEPIITECYQEGGYMLTFASNFPVNGQQDADGYISAIYEAEEMIPDVVGTEEVAPVFIGKQPVPVSITTEDDEEFLFMGAVWGNDSHGKPRYQE